METLKKLYNPLVNIKDEQWMKLVQMLITAVLELNARVLTKVEQMYVVGHYPAMYFRLTTVLERPEKEGSKPEVSGFVVGFDNDYDDDVFLESLSPHAYWEHWLAENGITTIFAYHEVGIRKIMRFFEKELKIWEQVEGGETQNIKEDEWREIALSF